MARQTSSLNEFKKSFDSLPFSFKFLILIPILVSLLLLVYIVQNKEINTSTDYVDAAKPVRTNNSLIYLSPSSSNISNGSTFSVDINLDTKTKAINALEATLNYPSSYLEATNLIVNNQVFDVTVNTNYSNGKVSLILGSTQPQTGNLKIATVTFKALQKGRPQVTFSTPLSVISHDANTPIPLSSINGKYNIR